VDEQIGQPNTFKMPAPNIPNNLQFFFLINK